MMSGMQGMPPQMMKRGAEAPSPDDNDSRDIDPEEQEHHASHGSVNGTVVDQLGDDIEKVGLPDLHQDGDK